MKKSISYIFYAFLLWFTALSVNYVSYSITDDSVALRKTINLSVKKCEIPHSSVKDTEVNIVSFNQRVLHDEKKNFHHDFLNSPNYSGYFLSNEIFFINRHTHDYRFYQLPPFDFLTHQFLI